MLITSNQGLYTAIDKTLGIIAYKVSREVAIEKILAAFEDSPPISEVATLLDTIPEPGAWRTEFAAAVAIELHQHGERLEDTPTTQELRDVEAKVKLLSADQQELLAQLRYESIMEKVRKAKEALEAERIRLLEVLAKDIRITFNSAQEQFNEAVIQQLRQSPLWDIAMGREVV